ncbi:Glycosyltransferase [Rhodovulum sp. PH10]|uniref:glycosyltransferase n=1 Tax=Rhodovulum sp. PH10 TaxID=1187851 RepID=UPI00027C249D|nr:glycosyltransferase [Rhodovulum sp. PH10]EJW13083.1 Glycosyltransferase [Rhodovulum sp. PH10]
MADIVITDTTGGYDGRDLETRPLGGTETSVIRLARELVRRNHRVTVFSNCAAPVEDHGVQWRPVTSERPETCDLYVACQHPRLLSFVKRPKRLAVWVLWQPNHLKHYKQIGKVWWHRPIPVLQSLHQVRIYSPFLPRRNPHILIPLALGDDVRGFAPLSAPPPRRAIFASNPQRNLRRLVEIWGESILPRVPDAVLDVFGVHQTPPGVDPWDEWAGSLLPANPSPALRASVRVHPTVSRETLIGEMRGSRVMLYLGHKVEAFCLAVGEAQALGVPAVVAPVAAVPERVLDGITGFHEADPARFAERAVALLTDDDLWRRQHEAALRHQQGISWSEYAGRFEAALLADRFPITRSVLDVPPPMA